MSSTKIHTRTVINGRSLCGHGKDETIKSFSDFFAAPEANQCASCLDKVRKRGYSIATLRRRYQRLETSAPAAPAAATTPATSPASATMSLYDEVKKTALAMLGKTIAQIERNQNDILRFERLCAQLRERGFTFAHQATPHPYAINYSIKLDRAQTRQLSELLAELSRMGYTDHDPAFPTITGLRALEITGSAAPTFTLNYARQATPSIAALTQRLALNQLEEAHHAHRFE